MAYTAKAKELRRCRWIYPEGHPRAGERCQAWAMWDSSRGYCWAHGGRPPGRGRIQPLCTCEAYAWPHRSGGGLCRWPDPPQRVCPIPAGTHSFFRIGIPAYKKQKKKPLYLPKPEK